MTKAGAKSSGDKAERLAAALRENLKRRKAQSREATLHKDQAHGAELDEGGEASGRTS